MSAPNPSRASPAGPAAETATFAGGCFWCTEAIFSELEGVVAVMPGYSGGQVANPSYEQVCTGTTGHAEAIEVTFDPAKVSYHDLLVVFLTTHDPTTLNRQGPDTGTQYRSAIYYHSPAQKAAAEAAVAEIEQAKVWKHRLVTEIAPAGPFYPAEEYHRNYFRRNPERGYCAAVIAPKVAKFRKQYAPRLKIASV